MIAGSYVDYLFGVATGWLGWSPKTAWKTPIPELMLALNARIEWCRMTGEISGAGHTAPPPAAKANVADKLKAALRGGKN